MNLTAEQQVLLDAAIANRDVVLVTGAGSPNDELWRALTDRGLLEMVTDIPDPKLKLLVDGCGLRVYRVREDALKTDPASVALSARAVEQMQAMGRVTHGLS